jgi:hypothetical protein
MKIEEYIKQVVNASIDYIVDNNDNHTIFSTIIAPEYDAGGFWLDFALDNMDSDDETPYYIAFRKYIAQQLKEDFIGFPKLARHIMFDGDLYCKLVDTVECGDKCEDRYIDHIEFNWGEHKISVPMEGCPMTDIFSCKDGYEGDVSGVYSDNQRYLVSLWYDIDDEKINITLTPEDPDTYEWDEDEANVIRSGEDFDPTNLTFYLTNGDKITYEC